MTRRHYKAIAAILNNALDNIEETSAVPEVTELAHALADYFKTENANFDRTRFLEACGITND